MCDDLNSSHYLIDPADQSNNSRPVYWSYNKQASINTTLPGTFLYFSDPSYTPTLQQNS
jgi:hypothetical protein